MQSIVLKRSVSNVHYYNLDLTDFASIQTTAEEIRKDHGHPSILINNAGIDEHIMRYLASITIPLLMPYSRNRSHIDRC